MPQIKRVKENMPVIFVINKYYSAEHRNIQKELSFKKL